MQITLKRLLPFEGDDAEFDSRSGPADISLILSRAVSTEFKYWRNIKFEENINVRREPPIGLNLCSHLSSE
jgi:hypothetical protein